jgi:putative aminopeptidase FrvX
MTTTRMPPTTQPALRDLVHQLTDIAAPSGNEDRMVAYLVDRLRERGLSPVVDRIGNVRIVLGEQDGRDPILVFAHTDELGLVVRNVEPTGYLRLHRLGGVPERVLPGTRVVVHSRKGDLPGIIGLKAHHLTPPEEKYGARPAADLYLDVGASSAADVSRLGIRVGDPVTYQPAWTELGEGRIVTKSLDDRLGVAALLELVDRLADAPPSAPVVIAFSVQEEFNVRGTLALATALRPAVAIGLDITPATDTPDLAGETPVRLGGGPVLSRLTFHGRGTLGGLVPDPALVRAIEGAASSAGLPLQYEAIIGVITDAAFLPMATPEGIATAAIGIPVRYTHSPVEMAALADVEATTQLLVALLEELPRVRLERGRAALNDGGMA